jgi:biotin carboxyl carrier protein
MRKTAAQASVEGAVTAPMTGRIVKMKVTKGEQVQAKQVLCIIEAMKMENEISAPKAGIIQEVNVSEGSPVSEGEILFVIS